ncbi:MAG: PAS domain-containing protein, partial [Geminicoccaceae bacterium]|nr:PAS domain-containing protein [Geminicoccaceae bacterium]
MIKPLTRIGWRPAGSRDDRDTPQASPSDRLRKDRDRFLGFAFASGCVLIEVRADGRIEFAAGALMTFLSSDAEQLIGRSLLELVAPADRGALAAAITQLRAKGRLLPLALRLHAELTSGQSMVVTGCRLPGGDEVVHLSLRPTAPGETVPSRDAASGLLDRSGLSQAVCNRLARTESGAQPLLTFLELEGLEALNDRLSADDAESLPQRIGCLLADASSGGSAARVADDRFALMHEPGVVIAELEQTLASRLREADPLGQGVMPRSMTLPLDMTEELVAETRILFALVADELRRSSDLRHALEQLTRARFLPL